MRCSLRNPAFSMALFDAPLSAAHEQIGTHPAAEQCSFKWTSMALPRPLPRYA